MAVSFSFEFLGTLSINGGQTVNVGWELFPGEFPPLIDHSIILRGGPGRNFVEVRDILHEGVTPGAFRAFNYNARNLSPNFIFTGMNYIFPKVS
jgi:hypothetical protein